MLVFSKILHHGSLHSMVLNQEKAKGPTSEAFSFSKLIGIFKVSSEPARV
jgi:hypothetical protein